MARELTTEAGPAAVPEVEAERRRLPMRRWVRELGWRHLVLVIGVLFALYPIVWIISAAFNPVDTLNAATLIPAGATLDNFKGLVGDPLTPFLTWLWNSWKVSLTAAVITTFVGTLAAFAFSRLRFRGRRVGLTTLLLVQVFPQFLAFIALFVLMQSIGVVWPAVGLNTHIGLILVYLGGAIGFNTFLLKGFLDSIPFSLDESAHVDGATPWQLFYRILLPLMRPILVVLFVISLVSFYNEVLLATTLLSGTEQYTYAVGLSLFTTSDYTAKWGLIGAAAVVGALPIVIMFLALQNQIVGGLTAGAVKG
jgi:arabinogalactan oligomer / maltooligosaccharide transport system permease protein